MRLRLPRRRSRQEDAAKSADRRGGSFWLSVRSHRERVIYYYLSALRRARNLGLGRRSAQTPYEYGTVLKPNLPEAQQEMDLLTDAFVEARYSGHGVAADEANRVRGFWERVRTAMRTLQTRRRKAIQPEQDVSGE